MYFTLDKVFELTKAAFAKIDATYWQKCIDHMWKEVEYYMEHDKEDELPLLVDLNMPVVSLSHISKLQIRHLVIA